MNAETDPLIAALAPAAQPPPQAELLVQAALRRVEASEVVCGILAGQLSRQREDLLGVAAAMANPQQSAPGRIKQ